MATRQNWIDQARGLSIFMVIYGHNFPSIEPYIYSFHVPLFFFISGMFHPEEVTKKTIFRRSKMILIPYFIWSFGLFLFWAFFGKNYGASAESSFSVSKNFLGIFYAQGGSEYMDWGIPMWFLPCIFLVFLIFESIQRLDNNVVKYCLMLLSVIVGLFWAKTVQVSLPWSLDVACVALGFYALGNILKSALFNLKRNNIIWILLLAIGIHLICFYGNPEKVDMYRSTYGQPILFFISGFTGALTYVLFFKLFPIAPFLGYLGKHTIVLLATHSRLLTVLKMIAFIVLGVTVFTFTEWQKFVLAILQVILAIPVIWFINKYIPILDGKVKKH